MSGAGRNPPVAYTNADVLAYLVAGVAGVQRPDGDNTRDLGTTARRYANVFCTSIRSNSDGVGVMGEAARRWGAIYAMTHAGVETIDGTAGAHLLLRSNYGGIRLQPNNGAVYTKHPVFLRYPTNRAYSTNGLLLATAGTGAAQTITIGLTAPSCPQSINITVTNNAAPTGTVQINGSGLHGQAIADNIVIVPGATVQGVWCYNSILNVVIPAGVTAADTVSVGFGNRIGWSTTGVLNATGAAPNVWRAGVRQQLTAGYTVSIGGVDFTPGGALGADEIIELYYISDA